MSYNKVIMLGNLTRDPELRYLPSQTAVVSFGIATNRKWTRRDGQVNEEVCFVDCSMFGKRGETINKYFKKGDPILIDGHLVLDTWQAQDGSQRSKHKIAVDNFEFIGNKQTKQQDSPPPQNQNPDKPVDDIPF